MVEVEQVGVPDKLPVPLQARPVDQEVPPQDGEIVAPIIQPVTSVAWRSFILPFGLPIANKIINNPKVYPKTNEFVEEKKDILAQSGGYILDKHFPIDFGLSQDVMENEAIKQLTAIGFELIKLRKQEAKEYAEQQDKPTTERVTFDKSDFKSDNNNSKV